MSLGGASASRDRFAEYPAVAPIRTPAIAGVIPDMTGPAAAKCSVSPCQPPPGVSGTTRRSGFDAAGHVERCGAPLGQVRFLTRRWMMQRTPRPLPAPPLGYLSLLRLCR
jgi:hypothetical protein